MDETITERVLRCIEQVPAGSVVSYGDIGSIVGIVARHVGRVMSGWGSNVTWWRVTDRDGRLPDHLLVQALPHWADEGITLRRDGRGCRITDHRADLAQLATDYEQATADLEVP